MFHALPKEVISKTGTANVWASMSIDPERGILYIPVSSPSPNYYGGDRKEKLPLATSVTALDTETGKVIWSRQLVHHDIWDLDTDAPPTLVDIQKDGKTIPALVQTSKQGFLYVLNRETGEPIYPIEERPVPASDVPGEEASPTQPYVAKPQRVIPDEWPGVSTLADWVGFGECSKKAASYRYDGPFTPPSLKGTIAFPPTTGGTEWGGGAVDPTQRHLRRQLQPRRADLPADPARPVQPEKAERRDLRRLRAGGRALRLPPRDLPELGRHALLEPALRDPRRLRPEDRRQAVERAVRPGSEVRLLHAGILGLGDHRRTGHHQVGPDLHRRLDGFAASGRST